MLKAEQVPETVAHVAEAAWSKGATWQQIIAAAINAWPGIREDALKHTYGTSRTSPTVTYCVGALILPLPKENING